MVFVLRHGSRSIVGVYLKSPEMKRGSMLTVNCRNTELLPVHMFPSYDTNYDVGKEKQRKRKKHKP